MYHKDKHYMLKIITLTEQLMHGRVPWIWLTPEDNKKLLRDSTKVFSEVEDGTFSTQSLLIGRVACVSWTESMEAFFLDNKELGEAPEIDFLVAEATATAMAISCTFEDILLFDELKREATEPDNTLSVAVGG